MAQYATTIHNIYFEVNDDREQQRGTKLLFCFVCNSLMLVSLLLVLWWHYISKNISNARLV